MKKLLLIVFSIFLTFSIAIAQDGINYQGAATDANGDELTNQNITIRASVLSTSANGNLEWEETHSATTDQFGLFNVVIGQGTNTTNGATATFDDMDWGSADHFLKIEMDATGGTNYAMIGTTQMMSVPYALYAKSAGIDSTMLANMIGSSGGGMGGGGCDFQFPEGLDGEPITLRRHYSSPYIVPMNKRLIVLYTDATVEVNGITFTTVENGEVMILNSGDSLSAIYGTGDLDFNGFLTEPNPSVTPITLRCHYSSPYIVPMNKRLIVLYTDATVEVNGITFTTVENGEVMILNSGDSLSAIYGTGDLDFNGYLVDENYFANCGGGSSSTSSLDSAMVANMIASSGGGRGCNYAFPDGFDGEGITWNLHDNGLTNYTVPLGKILYITNYYAPGPSGADLRIDGEMIRQGVSNEEEHYSFYLPLVVNSSQVVSTTHGGDNNFSGILIDAGNVEGITRDLWSTGNYTVPSGKRLYITNYFTTSSSGDLRIDGERIRRGRSNYQSYSSFDLPVVVNSGQVVSSNLPNTSNRFNGYLVDENYFAGCGGGGSSSSSAGLDSATVATMIANAVSAANSSTSVSTFGDTLTVNGQSIIVPGISFSNVVPVFGSVTDIDGNTYPTVLIGTQEWMTEYLYTSSFSNGANINDINQLGATSCNSSAYKELNNIKHYNGYAVQDSRNVCPSGWHVPTLSDFETLLDVFGDIDSSNPYGTGYGAVWPESGKHLKSTNSFWNPMYATNYSYMNFPLNSNTGCNTSTVWPGSTSGMIKVWTSSNGNANPSLWYLELEDNKSEVEFYDQNLNKINPIRCIKD